jgi:D-alanyl-D-alanine carboxypeptidase/D-alanyl-D-alanine-endopeptidase (penicillin-binding protein 4)
VLEGDLVLVASGDPNLSGRSRADETLAFTDMDHAYASVLPATAVEGDPLAVLRDLARQVATRGIRAVRGSVRVDARLFPEGAHEHGTGVTISPIALNDNVVDVFLSPGAAIGEPARLRISPDTTYARFENAATTVAEGTAQLTFDAQRDEDGSFTVTARGSTSITAPERLFVYAVESPGRFAAHAFAGALREAGVDVRVAPPDGVSAEVGAESHLVAEHVSPPFSEAVKVTLKVSQNLHAAMMPYLVGAELGGDHDSSDATGFGRMAALLTGAGLDLSEAAQSDGEGGPGALFSARFLTRFLVWMSQRDDFPAFEAALPVLGRDGTLAHTLRDSPMAGKLRAKTGTLALGNALGGGYVIMGKGLAGYLTTASGRKLAFAVFANHVSTPPEMESVLRIGDDLAEMAEAVYRLR